MSIRPLWKRLLLIAFSVGGLAAAPGDLLWQFPTEGIVYSSPALDAAGNLYFGSEDGEVYSVTASGHLRWSFGGSTDWVDSSPAIGPDGTVYVGSWDGNLYALAGGTGSEKWRFSTEAPVIGSPAVASDGTVYVVSYDGALHALSPSGTLKWSFFTTAEIESSPGLDEEGNLYFGNLDGIVYSLDSAGNLRWERDLSVYAGLLSAEVAIQSSPAIGAYGRLYLGTRSGLIVGLDKETGTVDWVFEAQDYVDSSPALGPDGNVVVASRDGYLYKLSPQGVLLWELLVGDVFYASPAIDAEGRIHLGAYLGEGLSAMRAISAQGTIEWEFVFEGFNDSSPNLAADGTVYFGAHNFNLYALEGQSALGTASAWPRFRGNRPQTGRAPAGFETVAPWIRFGNRASGIEMTWGPPGLLLHEAASPAGPWTLAEDQSGTRVLAPADGGSFFRVQE